MVKNVIQETLFWGHIFIVAAGILMGWFLPLWLVVSLVLIHRAHILLFKGCVISRMQRRFGDLGEQGFLQRVSDRFFHKRITKTQGRIFDVVLSLSPIALAITKRFIIES